jgi:hypothetical protein
VIIPRKWKEEKVRVRVREMEEKMGDREDEDEGPEVARPLKTKRETEAVMEALAVKKSRRVLDDADVESDKEDIARIVAIDSDTFGRRGFHRTRPLPSSFWCRGAVEILAAYREMHTQHLMRYLFDVRRAPCGLCSPAASRFVGKVSITQVGFIYSPGI